MRSFRDIIDAWPKRRDLAADLGVDLERVQKWHQRDSIPAQMDGLLVAAARGRGIAIDFADLALLRAAPEVAAE